MPTYRLDILVTGTDRASPQLSRLSGALGRVWQIASGILIAGTIRALTGQLFELGQTAIESYSNFERMQVSLQSLIARELARGEEVETTSSFIRNLTEAEILQLDKLIVKYDALGNELLDLQDAQAGVDPDDIAWLEYSVAIRETQSAMAETGAEIERLQGLQGKLVSVTETHLEKTISLAEALGLAAGPAKELTDWIVRLSLRSPFEENDVLMALRVAAGYGFITQYATDLRTEEERLAKAREDDVVTAQRLTVGLLDLMAAIGLPSENLQRIVLALGQVRAHGKLLAQEIRQLINAGVGLDIMAMAMGMTVEEFQSAQKEGKILAEDFLPALIKLLEDDLAGSAERIMNTFGGAILSLRKFREVALRTFFGPTFRAITPALRAWADELTSQESLDKIEAWGIKFRDWLIEIYGWIKAVQGFVHGIRNDLDYIQRHGLFNITLDFAAEGLGEDLVAPLRTAVSEAQDLMNQYPLVEDPEAGKKGAMAAGLAVLVGPTVWGLLKRVGPKIIGILLGIGTKFSWLGIAASIAGFLIGGNWDRIKEGAAEMWENVKPKLEEFRTWLETNIPIAMEELRRVWEEDVLPELERGWLWVEENVLPILIEWASLMKQRVVEGLKAVRKWVAEELHPKLVELWEFLRDDLIPELTTLAVDTFIQVGEGAKSVGKDISQYLTPKMQSIKDKWELIQPSLEAFGNWLSERFKRAGSDFKTAFEKFIGPPLGLLMHDLDLLTAEDGTLMKFWRGFKDFADKIAKDVKYAWDEYLVPIWEYFSGGFTEHVLPLLSELVRLFENLRTLFILIGGDAWKKLHEALGGLHSILDTKLNPVVDEFWNWINDTYDSIVEDLQPALDWLTENVLPPLQSAFEWLAGVVDDVTAAVKNLNEALENVVIPYWAEKHSPPPLASAMREIADATRMADQAWKSSVFTGAGRFANLNLMPSQGALTAQPAPVYIGGDRNTYYVGDRGTAQFVAHQIAESKKKRFSEFMGR